MSSDEDEDSPEVEQPPEFDMKVMKDLIAALQRRGENVLMDELIDATEVDEWDVARVLDVLVGLQLAAIEKQRGNALRNSRAFAYRSSYALPRTVPLDSLRESIEKQESLLTERLDRVKRLKEQLEVGNAESDIEFLRKLAESHSDDGVRAFIQRVLDSTT